MVQFGQFDGCAGTTRSGPFGSGKVRALTQVAFPWHTACPFLQGPIAYLPPLLFTFRTKQDHRSRACLDWHCRIRGRSDLLFVPSGI